ncbi:uncharacterized protein SCHCODRAFT_02745340 [Schizophyllum commune H4-8]|uniref:uncharacterized protein n=1 Tax=Schizophyllum commune (strain H4-8 / FGSC 9210) TaxID=578458 RepID=UPI00215FDE7A|nr:uncharacterized protein SCHCODRAFT_02745340 [Schizophyllum commune H4-8]KAI5896336.1 hypothetical protein SCHCODRAFT_02745340 [Schizophyllum commune H4-8]
MQRFQAFPEELIREVLCYVIDVPTDAEFFSSNGKREEYYSNKPARWREPLELRAAERRPPALLLVCKDWQRICTPILYRTAIIRSKGQADALTITITRVRPELAGCVKRLRLKGAIGMEILGLLNATPRLTHLALVLHIFSKESVSYLCRGLRLDHINPTMLLLADSPKGSTKGRAKLMNTLTQTIPTWTSLRVVDMPCMQKDSDVLVELLAHVPQIHTVIFPDIKRPGLEQLQALGRNRSLRCIFFKKERLLDPWDECAEWYTVDEEVIGDPRLSALCQYDTPDGRQLFRHSRNPHHSDFDIAYVLDLMSEEESEQETQPTESMPGPPIPILTHPVDVQERIWSRVFEHVEADVNRWGCSLDSRRRPAFLSLAQVCQLFRRLLLLKIYTKMGVADWRQARQLGLLLDAFPAFGRHVRELSVHNQVDHDRFWDPRRALQLVPNLTSLQSTRQWTYRGITPDWLRLKWATFTMLAKTAKGITEIRSVKIAQEFAKPKEKVASEGQAATSGDGQAGEAVASSTRAGASANTGDTRASQQGKKPPAKRVVAVPVGPLSVFRSLKVLELDGAVKLKFKQKDIPDNIFPVLEELRFTSGDTSVLKMFTLFELPRLRRLALFHRAQTANDAGDFLEKHGPKVEDLDIEYFPTESVFEMCTSIQTLRVRESKLPPDYTAEHWRSDTLTTIEFPSRLPVQIPSCRPWGPLLSSLDPAKLPTLKTVRLRFLRWPVEQRAIDSCFWVPYAEELLEKGIEVLSGYDEPWTPRVKPRASGGKAMDVDMDAEVDSDPEWTP